MAVVRAEAIAKAVDSDAALEFWKQRAKLTDREAKAMGDGAKHRAFYVSGLARRDLVSLVSDALEAAVENGETLAEFKARIADVIDAQGWHSYRVENIFRTNLQTAYAAGRYKKMQAVKESRPFWQYLAIMDNRVRPSHAILHGAVYPADHEFWSTNYPPNGFRCRCGVRTLSARQVAKEGLTVQKEMPKSGVWTDPKNGMEYFVHFPGADKGFRNNPGKDWLDGLDLKKYPDLTPKSYEEQRGPASKRPKPVKTYDELCEGIKERCSEFATNNGVTSVVVDHEDYFMATYCDGRFMLSDREFHLSNGRRFNAARELKSAWNSLAEGKKLSWEEEYSIESLWHEITHNRQTRGFMPSGSPKQAMMEVVTQWTARRSYQELIEALGGKAEHQADIIKNGLGYGTSVRRFDRLLEVLGVKDGILLPKLQSLIANQRTPEYLDCVKEELVSLSGAKKSAVKKALSNLACRVDFERLLRDCGLVS